jgi:hypothetical protein
VRVNPNAPADIPLLSTSHPECSRGELTLALLPTEIVAGHVASMFRKYDPIVADINRLRQITSPDEQLDRFTYWLMENNTKLIPWEAPYSKRVPHRIGSVYRRTLF